MVNEKKEGKTNNNPIYIFFKHKKTSNGLLHRFSFRRMPDNQAIKNAIKLVSFVMY